MPMKPAMTAPSDQAAAPQSDPAAPIEIEVTRGSMVESRHRVVYALADSSGRVLRRAGDPERVIYPRSAAKPLQALALVESGAADAFGLGDAEIALACASHSAEPRHVETVRAWLARIGCSPADLECGPQLPSREQDLKTLFGTGAEAEAVHNNCSGKHSGFLSVARHLGVPTAGYIKYEHPVQQRVLGILESLAGLDLSTAPRGVDGCGIPVIGVPLGNLALAMARFADPADQPETRQKACARVRAALAAEPFMIAGSGRFCSDLIAASGGRVLAKTGAEGVFCVSLTELGLGFALKVEDGATRAAEVATINLLRDLGLLDAETCAAVERLFEPPILNRAGDRVGLLRPAAGAPV